MFFVNLLVLVGSDFLFSECKLRGSKMIFVHWSKLHYLQLNSAWDALNKTWKERVDKLAEAMQAAVQYQDGLQVSWCDILNPVLS